MQSCAVPNTIVVERDVLVDGANRVEKEFIPYLNEFKNQCGIKPELSIRFGILKSPVVGVCIYDLFNPNIIIDENAWGKYGLNQREVLIFHELGHCALFKPHNKKLKNETPVSIMYPTILGGDEYSNGRSKYLKELCN